MSSKVERQVLWLCLLTFLLAAMQGLYFWDALSMGYSWTWIFITGAGTCIGSVAVLVCIDIWSLQPADSHTYSTLLSQYLFIWKIRLSLVLNWRYLRNLANDPMKINSETLLRIIRDNEDTIYGRQHNFKDIRSMKDFIKLHPITNDKVNKPWMDRVSTGEKNVLFPGDTAFLASTSGTTGEPKVYPMQKKYVDMLKEGFHFAYLPILKKFTLKRTLDFHVFSEMKLTTGGIPIGALSQLLRGLSTYNITPGIYNQIYDADASYYVMALFALAEAELYQIITFSSDLTYSFMKFMVTHWLSFCEDIENGEVGRSVVKIEEELRVALSKRLRADLERARYLREVIKDGEVGLAKRTWPSMSLILMGKSAGFKLLATNLMENHFKGINVVEMGHGATEGVTGLNFEEEPERNDAPMSLLPGYNFVEFIPLENIDDDQPETVQIDKVECGKCYEVVQTNMNGLYRCRYGDIIKIVGFNNKLPKYKFLYRTGQRLNIAYDRTPDKFLYEALTEAVKAVLVGPTLVDYTTTESFVVDTITGVETKGHYIFFIEFSEVLAKDVCSSLAEQTDKSLQEMYALYKRYRNNAAISDLEIIQVKPDILDSLQHVLMGERYNPQFKLPRVLRKEHAIRFLVENRVEYE